MNAPSKPIRTTVRTLTMRAYLAREIEYARRQREAEARALAEQRLYRKMIVAGA